MERLEPPADLWADPRLCVARSGIEGHGLFATAPIPEGEVVLWLTGRLVTSAELEALIAANDADRNGIYVDSITIYEDAHLVLPPGSAAHFGNHSCDPSAWLKGTYTVAARRDLEPGDELTLDYATFSGAGAFEMACHCGSPVCRGQVTSDDWRQLELQARYTSHWAPALAARIATG